jgi:hypothetical protein
MKESKEDIRRHMTEDQKYSLRSDRASGVVKYIETLCYQDSCEVCKEAARKRYRLDEAPILPIAGCQRALCRCCYVPVLVRTS